MLLEHPHDSKIHLITLIPPGRLYFEVGSIGAGWSNFDLLILLTLLLSAIQFALA